VSPNKTYNLLELVNGVREQLGITELVTGHYTQMRLIIGDSPDDTINLLSEGHPYANHIIDNSELSEIKLRKNKKEMAQEESRKFASIFSKQLKNISRLLSTRT